MKTIPTPPNTALMKTEEQRSAKKGFTLLELLVSLTVLSLLLLLVFDMLDKTQQTWVSAEARVSQFREARNAFELVTRRTSQAVLNTYWNYERTNPDSPPTNYIPYSELHFLCGPMDKITSNTADSAGHGIFFQAPLGYTITDSKYDFSTLLNSCGFFLNYDTDANDKPSFVRRIAPDRSRYRLMEFQPPAEEMKVYESLDGKYGAASLGKDARNKWFQDDLKDREYARPVAENIVALVFRPMKSELEQGLPTDIAPNYVYDSRAWQDGGGAQSKLTKNILPPIIEITMVAVSERSMIRYQQLNGDGEAKWASGLFSSNANDSSYKADLETLKSKLIRDKMDFRVFQEVVGIRASKWGDFSDTK